MKLNRRQMIQLGAASAMAAPAAAHGICLNEDNSHFFSTRAGKKLDAAAVDAFIDQYAGTQVRELLLSANSMRTSFASKVWDPIWKGYDPDGPDSQPLLASTPPEARAGARKWIHTAWQLHHDGIDVYARWIARARQRKLSPWISMRMNDLHNVDDEQSFMHSDFWRSNPQFRRVPYRFSGWTDRAFDYGHREVREYHLGLVRELAERYDFDGLELDWMRFGYHFRPGHEAQGAVLMTEFTAQVRELLRGWEKKRGHRIRLAARIPSRPQTARNLGYDAVTWARRGLVDMLVITPFWASIETDMPVEVWKDLLAGTNVQLAAGLELLVRPYNDYRPILKNSLETVRGAAASLLDRGADRVYLFNYMDSETAIDRLDQYPQLLQEVGELATLKGKPRRHVVTYADTWAPGEARPHALPARFEPKQWLAFRVPTGPKPQQGRVQIRLGMSDANTKCLVLLNGVECQPVDAPKIDAPAPKEPVLAYAAPLSAVQRGDNLIEAQPQTAGQLHWVEIAML